EHGYYGEGPQKRNRLQQKFGFAKQRISECGDGRAKDQRDGQKKADRQDHSKRQQSRSDQIQQAASCSRLGLPDPVQVILQFDERRRRSQDQSSYAYHDREDTAAKV